MDAQVIAAMARWPDVLAVHGWLSLTEAGQWRLHPDGNAVRRPASPGEAITSPQILAFIDRNYAADPLGQWYFQNGPQRVYVRLDAAPFVARTTTDPTSGRLMLRTHTGLDIRQVEALYLDDAGRLYAATDHGPCLIAGRDLPALLDALRPEDHAALNHCLETGVTTMVCAAGIQGFPDATLPLHQRSGAALENALGFRRLTQAETAGTPLPDDPTG